MAFKIRDLMISVLAPDAGAGCATCTGTTNVEAPRDGCPTCTGTTGQDQAPYGCHTCTGTTHPPMYGGCPACTGTTNPLMFGGGCPACTGTTGDVWTARAAALMACGVCTGVSPVLADRRPEALAALRQQLQGLLAEVEAEERRLEDAGFPQTAEEVESLEKKLEEALAEVRSRKAGLKKG
ncbi:MAG: hypothetical protein ABUT39_19545 [Acidobacteriota bacterium]